MSDWWGSNCVSLLVQDEDKKDVDKEKDKTAAVAPKDAEKKEEVVEEKKKEVEPPFEMLANPARVMKPQVGWAFEQSVSIFFLKVVIK